MWTVIGGGTLALSSCYGRNCEGAQFQYGADAGQGEMLDENTWESSPQISNWLPFPRQHSYVFTIPFSGRTPAWAITYVSGQQNPNTSGNFTTGAGNLTEQAGVGPNQILAVNDTCSDYFLRVVAWAPPLGTLDAGSFSFPSTTTGDSGAADAASDATVH